MDKPSIGDVIRARLASKGLTQKALASIMGRYPSELSNLMSGKAGVTPDLAVGLAAALGDSPAFWLDLDASRQLSLLPPDAGVDVARRARLFQLAPIQDMEARGWIKVTATTDELEAELCRFFGKENLNTDPELEFAARRPDADVPLSVEQKAWVFRARQIAETMVVADYDPQRIAELQARLRTLAAYADEATNVPIVLAEYGVRLIIIEPLSGGSMDGAAFWLDSAHTKPVIVLSMRIDRYDAFWFTLCHEVAHIKYQDLFSMDVELVGKVGYAPSELKPEAERRADHEAATLLLPESILSSFIGRVGPLYSKERIVQFANRNRVHPGIVVGQLQHRGEIGYSANREMLVKIRARVLPSAIVDGWGRREEVG